MDCPKCGEKNSENAKFCKQCGELLNDNENSPKTDNKNKILIAALIAVIAILAVGILFGGGLFKSEVPLQSMDFEVFTMDVPVGADFKEFTSIPAFGNIGGLVYLQNNGSYSSEVSVLGVSKMGGSVPDEMKFDREEGNITIFKDDTGLYLTNLNKDDFSFSLMGRDPDTMVKMLNTIDITDSKALSSDDSKTQETSSTKTTQAQAPAPKTTSMSILGGSFSTGSELEDKTYASIYVGANHAGESVQLQIWYSRDGSTLNHGNMVPVTVDSSGYLDVSSADSYSKFPDFAEINLYDGSGSKLLDTRSVSLSPTSGTQNF